jgi:fibronectin type III domain protein
MHDKEFRGRAYRWILAAVLITLLGGCHDDNKNRSAGTVPPPPAGNAPPPPASPAPPAPAPAPQARAATLEWTVPTTETDGSALTNLAGYRIHYGKSVMMLDTVIEIRNPSVSSYVIEGLSPGTYYFAVSAFNTRNHESERSNAGRKQII